MVVSRPFATDILFRHILVYRRDFPVAVDIQPDKDPRQTFVNDRLPTLWTEGTSIENPFFRAFSAWPTTRTCTKKGTRTLASTAPRPRSLNWDVKRSRCSQKRDSIRRASRYPCALVNELNWSPVGYTTILRRTSRVRSKCAVLRYNCTDENTRFCESLGGAWWCTNPPRPSGWAGAKLYTNRLG